MSGHNKPCQAAMPHSVMALLVRNCERERGLRPSSRLQNAASCTRRAMPPSATSAAAPHVASLYLPPLQGARRGAEDGPQDVDGAARIGRVPTARALRPAVSGGCARLLPPQARRRRSMHLLCPAHCQLAPRQPMRSKLAEAGHTALRVGCYLIQGCADIQIKKEYHSSSMMTRVYI